MFSLLSILLLSATLFSSPQSAEVTTSNVSATVKSEADLKEIGLPVYPGSRLREDSKEGSQATLGLWISDKGFRLVAVKYESSDSPEKILAYYRKALGKFGTVLQCPGGGATASGLTCKDHDRKEGVVDLMAGSTEKRRIVGVEPASHGRTRFELVYLRTKGIEAHQTELSHKGGDTSWGSVWAADKTRSEDLIFLNTLTKPDTPGRSLHRTTSSRRTLRRCPTSPA